MGELTGVSFITRSFGEENARDVGGVSRRFARDRVSASAAPSAAAPSAAAAASTTTAVVVSVAAAARIETLRHALDVRCHSWILPMDYF